MTEKPQWWQRKLWQLIMVGVAAALIGFVAGIWGSASERDSLQERLDAANLEINQYAAKHDAFVAEAKSATAAVGREFALIRKRRKALDRRESNLVTAENEAARNTFTDGIWKVGTDINPGTYRSTARDCYWEKLTDPGGGLDSIITNGSGPNQTIAIDSAWFSANGCGAWQKVE